MSSSNTSNNIKNRPINVALIGCGRISFKHITSIIKHKNNLKLVAICDCESNKINSIKDFILKETRDLSFINGISIYKSYDKLLLDKIKGEIKVDLVVLTTPSGLHPSQAIKGAKHGVHVCTEKPMATNLEDGKKMVKECKEAGVSLFVVKQNRYNSTLKLLKRQIELNRFGPISMITVNVFWQRPQSYYDSDDWRGTRKYDGGALMNQASHYVDLIYWLNGPIESISAVSETIGRDIEVEDTLAMHLKWKNGTIGTMAVTMLTYPQNLEGSITILGEKGSVRLGGKAVNNFEIWEFNSKSEDDLLVKNSCYPSESVYGYGHPAFYEEMIKDLKGYESNVCNGQEGLKSLEIIIAAYKSAETSMRVNLPLL